MKPLERAKTDPDSSGQTYRDLLLAPVEYWAKTTGIPESELTREKRTELAHDVMKRSEAREVWMNNLYTVSVFDEGETEYGRIKHLSIRRNDRKAVTDWRHKQEIKNQLCGEEAEGIELYPAESRVVDTANQYHIWVFLDMRIPVGFEHGAKLAGDQVMKRSKQREFETK